ncbi:MmpS family transport accessory protein [Actinomadura opuntiae]|uniref:MmpS family transport accessory protein n=1 Tax=Actinomadura sp. OS1-43 TaxID=604315 RepID=UPI00255AF27C|nr:MmpS family transport accessory protein [Actinomadura sp. OS1-43]MDL4821013.1 MmpS family transport accessory protein [Actinomadura sp. OS1-43]
MRITAIAAVAGATVLTLSLTACNPDEADPNIAQSGKPAAKTSAKKKGRHTVTYQLGGTAKKGDITYSTPSGQEQQNGAKLPWKKTFTAGKAAMLDVSVQNTAMTSSGDLAGGTITCKIYLDGKLVKQAKSSGQAAIASCDHMTDF